MAFTFFFRDLDTLELAVSNLLEAAAGRSRVRIWDAGCAMGQEPYTLAVVLAERMNKYAWRNVEIHATDYDAPLLQIVREATYPAAELQRVPPALFEKYWEPVDAEKTRYRLVEQIRNVMHISHHDLLSLRPVRTGFSLIVCKNVLLHFQPQERIEVIRMFHHALEPNGLLATEHTQKLPTELTGLFQQVGSVNQVYRKVDNGT